MIDTGLTTPGAPSILGFWIFVGLLALLGMLLEPRE